MPACPRLPLLLTAFLFLAACDSSEPAGSRIVAGVDLDVLFAAPTPAEVQAVQAGWLQRDVTAQNVVLVASDTINATGLGASARFDARVYRHDVGATAHYGLVLIPRGLSGPAPVVVYAHGGDTGVDAEGAAAIAATLTPPGASYVWVVPSFRAEALTFFGQTFTSEGAPSPWDHDVDDALALLSVTAQQVPRADVARTRVLGLSRGGGVALLMGIRDSRVQRVLDFFGPTDFYDPFIQDIVVEALRGQARALPGFDVLNARFVQPLAAGTLSVEAMRAELLRRSPLYFASRLPAVQVQHGTADAVVAVSQSRRLAQAMQERSDFEYLEWPGAGHTPFEFPLQWIEEAQAFLAGP